MVLLQAQSSHITTKGAMAEHSEKVEDAESGAVTP